MLTYIMIVLGAATAARSIMHLICWLDEGARGHE